MAGLAPSPLHVEAEPARLVAPEFGIIGGTEQGPDQVEGAGVGGRVGPGRPANGALVDVDHLVDVLDSVDPVMGQWPFPGSHELFGQSLVQNIVDQGAFAAATDPGDHRQGPQRNGHIDVLQVVGPGSLDGELFPVSFPPLLGHRDLFPAAEILAGNGFRHLADFIRRAWATT